MHDPPWASWDAFLEHLRRGLDAPLPGREAHLRMAPRPRPGWKPGTPEDARDSAALLLLFPRDGEPHLLLTKRSARLATHRGQVSLPGGVVEEGETFDEAALREAHEEAAVRRDRVRLVGRLSPLFIPVSGFVLHPVVALTDGPHEWRPEPAEVDRVFETPLAHLLDPARRDLESRGAVAGSTAALDPERRVPVFRVGGETMWGATAMILAEFLWILGRAPEPPALD